MLDALDNDVDDETMVRHHNGSLIIEEPHPRISTAEAGAVDTAAL